MNFFYREDLISPKNIVFFPVVLSLSNNARLAQTIQLYFLFLIPSGAESRRRRNRGKCSDYYVLNDQVLQQLRKRPLNFACYRPTLCLQMCTLKTKNKTYSIKRCQLPGQPGLDSGPGIRINSTSKLLECTTNTFLQNNIVLSGENKIISHHNNKLTTERN